MTQSKISDFGEKRLIHEFIRPLFNPSNSIGGVGDDCAMIELDNGQVCLFSTDRVPSDLIAFQLGLIDYYGLGKYLACLNMSDIAACGGKPQSLLLNLGLPNDFGYEDFKAICNGFGDVAGKYGFSVLGGDITASNELSISATAVGTSTRRSVLTRRGAKEGDSIFISKPLGITPAFFAYYLQLGNNKSLLLPSEIDLLANHFGNMEPLISFGLQLSESGLCTSCMDNTDGVGQSLQELADENQKAFVLFDKLVKYPDIVIKIANSQNKKPLELAFSAGVDLSLVGTLQGKWTQKRAEEVFGENVTIIGIVDQGNGVHLETNGQRKALQFSGWNYFSARTSEMTEKI